MPMQRTGEAVFLNERAGVLVGRDGARCTGNNGDAALDRDVAGLGLVAERIDRLGSGADKGNAGLLDLARELGIFG